MIRRQWLFAALVTLPAAAPAYADDARGKALFGSDCGLCHQRAGEGVAGQFPRLSGRIGPIAANPQGKVYLTHVLTAGMTGPVKIDGHTILGYMPSFGQVPAADVAAILTYASGHGGTPAVVFTTAEIEAARKVPMSPSAVHAEREKLVAARVVP